MFTPNLRKFREFNQGFLDIRQTAYAKADESSEIQQTLSVESLARNLIGTAFSITELAERFTLGWSHYVTLLSIDDADGRRFYEIEVAAMASRTASSRRAARRPTAWSNASTAASPTSSEAAVSAMRGNCPTP